MQSKYPPAELRYGENLVAIEDFNFHKDDADAGNPYNTTFGMKVISGAFQGVCIVRLFRTAILRFCETTAGNVRIQMFQCNALGNVLWQQCIIGIG